MRSVGICITRDEADIIAFTVLHHLLAGIGYCVVIDNGSSDDTGERIATIARKTGRVSYVYDPSPFRQGQIVSAAAGEAASQDETIVVVFDSDEFWDLSANDLTARFRRTDANAFLCEVQNFIQSRSVQRTTGWSWLRAYRRAQVVRGAVVQLVTEHKHGFVEVEFSPKVIFRARGRVAISTGAHHVEFDGKKIQMPSDINCLHLPLRSREIIGARAIDELRRAPHRLSPVESWQSLYWKSVAEQGETDAEWRANSYDRTGRLDVYGRSIETFKDFRLVRLLARAYAYGRYLGVPMSPISKTQRSSLK